MLKAPTTKVVLIKISKRNNKFPVKLRITFNRKQRFYPCNIDLSQAEFDKVFLNSSPSRKEKKIKDIAMGIEAKALSILVSSRFLISKLLKLNYMNIKSGEGDVYDLFTLIYNQLMSTDQVGSAIMYNTVMNSLKAFHPKLTFDEITIEFLNRYENWMLTNTDPNKKGKSMTTVGIYLRHLRAVYNRGIGENIADKISYPFGRNKYVIPVGNNIKKALTLAEVGKIFNYQTVSSGWECRAKDFWCF